MASGHRSQAVLSLLPRLRRGWDPAKYPGKGNLISK